MNNFIAANLTKAPVVTRAPVQNATPASATSSTNASSFASGASDKSASVAQESANRAMGLEVKDANYMQKATEAAAAEHKKTHEVRTDRTKIPVFKKQEEIFVDEYPEKRPRQSVHTAKRDAKRIRDKREPQFDTVDFSKGLMDILEKSSRRPGAVGRPQIYNQFSHTTNMSWGNGRFLDFFT